MKNMNREKLSGRESMQKISFEPPVIESFLDPARAAEVWPPEFAGNKAFLEQVEARKTLLDNLNDVFNSLPRPDISIEDGVRQGQMTEEQAEKFYDSLSDLLESGQDYRRIILYLPFESLPDSKWRPSGEKLRQASSRFRQAYMKTWKSLLLTQDVRANFVDGDVLEVERREGDLPRVVKAAHLIPKLVENGFLEAKEAVELMEESDDQVLKDSIADTLPILADQGHLTDKEIKYMEGSEDKTVNSMAHIVVSNMKAEEEHIGTTAKTITFSSVREELNKEFSRIEAEDYGDIMEKRKVWLQQTKRQEAIAASGGDINASILENKLADDEVVNFLTADASTASQQALVEGIRQVIESVASIDQGKAQALYAQYGKNLLKLWKNNDPEIKEKLTKTFHRFRQLKIIDDRQLAELDINMPKLSGPFSENLKAIPEEMNGIRDIAAAVEADPELSRLIYPVVLVYGSRLKGYGMQQADLDLGVFVRPGIAVSDRPKLQELLKKVFAHDKVQGKVTEFWLEEKDNQLCVRDFAEPDVSLGESYWTHVLFGAAWEGDKEVMRELREKLLAPYMHETDKKIQGREARGLYLEELERDTLQYRLMHKGYGRFYPPYGGIHTPHAGEIDGDSLFWDSGYRQLATKLFARKVFIPKITKL